MKTDEQRRLVWALNLQICDEHFKDQNDMVAIIACDSYHYQFLMVFRWYSGVSPRDHPELTKGVNVHVAGYSVNVPRQVIRHILHFYFRKCMSSAVRIVTGIRTGAGN